MSGRPLFKRTGGGAATAGPRACCSHWMRRLYIERLPTPTEQRRAGTELNAYGCMQSLVAHHCCCCNQLRAPHRLQHFIVHSVSPPRRGTVWVIRFVI